MAAITRRGALRIAMPAFASPPFFSAEGARPEGLDPDLARRIAEGLEVEVEFDRSPKTFNEAVDLVVAGGADLAVCKLSRTLHRGRVILYSRPYVQLNHGLIINRLRFATTAGGRDAEQVIRGFDGELGVIADSSFAEFAATRFPKARVHFFDGWRQMVAAIRDGTIEAAYRDDFEIKRLLRDEPSLTVVARSVTLTDLTDTLAIGVRADAPQLREFVDLFLDLSGMNKPLSADEVLDRYSGKAG